MADHDTADTAVPPRPTADTAVPPRPTADTPAPVTVSTSAAAPVPEPVPGPVPEPVPAGTPVPVPVPAPDVPGAPDLPHTPDAPHVPHADAPDFPHTPHCPHAAAAHPPPAPEAPRDPGDDLVDLAALGPEFDRDPYPVFAALRSESPVHHVRVPGGAAAWLVLGHDEVRAALADPRLSKEWANASPAAGLAPVSPGRHMLHADPPDHTRLRRLVSQVFTARRVAALEPRVQQLTDDLLDAALASPQGRTDLVESLAFPLPVAVICELLGVPVEDAHIIHAWSSRAMRQEHAGDAAHDYIERLLDARRDHPGDDLLSDLTHRTTEDGDRLTRSEVRGMIWLLLVAGHETTVHLIANTVLALLLHPEQLAEVRRDPGTLVPRAVEETLRYDGPAETSTYRFTTEPYPVGTTVVPGGGEPVIVAIGDTGRDPARFDDPDTFDVHREPRPHLGFGHGVHYCLGAPLARLEAGIAVRTLLDRCPDLRLDVRPTALAWRTGLLIRGPERLPVRLR